MKYTEEENKFFNDLQITPKNYIQVGARLKLDDYMKIRKWSGLNNYPVTWIIKRGIKDFIKNYIETGIMPMGETVNLGGRPNKEDEEY